MPFVGSFRAEVISELIRYNQILFALLSLLPNVPIVHTWKLVYNVYNVGVYLVPDYLGLLGYLL